LVALLFVQPELAQHAALVLGTLRPAHRRTVGVLPAPRSFALLGNQLVGGEVRQIVERLDARLAEHDQHFLSEVRDLGQSVIDTQLAALVAEALFLALERLDGAALQLFGQLLVEALDRGQLRQFDVGHFLELGETFGDQQLRQRLVDVELFLEHLRPLGELALPPLGRLVLGHDVDLALGELAGEPHVLPAATDRQRKLIVRNYHFDAVLILVYDHAADRRRLQRVHDERSSVLAPGDDVDLLTLQLLHHRLVAATLHADARADWVDARIATDHADLGATARIAGGGLDLDDAVVNFGHFLGEQLLHELRVRTAQENLRSAVITLDLHDQRPHAFTDTSGLARDLLVTADDAFGPAEIDDHVTELDRLDHPGDDLAGAVLEFLVLTLALGVADLLEDHLLGALRIDATEVDRRQRIDDEVADLGTRLQLLGLLQIDLLEIVLNFFDHLDNPPQAKVAGHRIELGANVVLGAVASPGGLLDRLFHRFDDDRLVDHLLGRDGIRDREQFGLVGGNRTGHQSSAFSSSSVSSISSTPLTSSGRVAAISLSVRTSFAE